MRKLFVTLVLILSLLPHVAFATPSTEMGNYYPRAMEIVELNYEDDIVVCEDATGHIWEFYDTDDWEVGDLVVAILCKNGTEVITDDYFVDIRWSGYYEPANRIDEVTTND